MSMAASMGHMGQQAYRLVQLSEGYLLAGRSEDASDLAARACEVPRRHKERGTRGYSLRLQGDIAACRELPESALAESHSQQALALAEALGMHPQRTAAMVLARCMPGPIRRSKPALSWLPLSPYTAPWT
jgi:hypothetical protein